MSSWKIEGKGFGRALEILIERTEPSDLILMISNLGIRNPGIPDSLNSQDWFLRLLERLNKNLQLPKLFEALSEKFDGDNPEDPDASELRKIVEDARPVSKPTQIAEPGSTPPPRPPRSPKLDRIILLGESTAISATPVREAREVLRGLLAVAFKGKKIFIYDWGDNWRAVDARAAEPEDAKALFVRVISTDVLNDNLSSLTSLPKKLGEKLKLQGPLDASQIVIWNCAGLANGPQNGNGTVQPGGADSSKQEPDETRAQLAQQRLLLAEIATGDFVTIVRSRLRLVKWPPVLRLEHPGNNKLLQNKLIEVILSCTREKCEPPYPQLLYLWGTSRSKADDTDRVMAEPKSLISDDASRDGLIIAIHDLNLTMTDDDKQAFWEFQQRLAHYDNLLMPIIKAKNIPDNKIVKLAIVWDRSLPEEQFPYAYMLGDWTIAGMKKEKEVAILKSEDECKIKEKIDALLGAD